MSAISQRLQPSVGPHNVARSFALVLGATYLAVGILGFFFTGFSGFIGHNTTVIVFQLNIFHNLVHIGIGAILLIASRAPDSAVTQGVLFGVGTLYVAATLLGVLNALSILSMHGHFAGDNFLHLASAAFALIGGMLGTQQQAEADRAYLA
jgi:ABC-type transport system involved in multi-copper enzyme maturation permease subunit